MPRPKSRMTRVLIMDDDTAVRDATAMLLAAKGFDVVAVADGKSGVEAVQAARFDLVIVDLFMPGMDGLQTTRAIRALDDAVPIIAVSGFMLGDWRLEMPNFDAMAAEAGAHFTLYKPFQPAVLFQAMQEALTGKAATGNAPPKPELSLRSQTG
jgi:CheY-like chemotaxis protein